MHTEQALPQRYRAVERSARKAGNDEAGRKMGQ
jgi:hypothetical protein